MTCMISCIINKVAGDKDISAPRGFLAFLTTGDRKWLQIGAVGKENAGILGSEGMARLGRDDKAERLVPSTGDRQLGHGKNEVIEPPGLARICHRFLPADTKNEGRGSLSRSLCANATECGA